MLHRVSITDGYCSSGEKEASFVLVSGCGEEFSDLWVTRPLPSCIIGVREGHGSQGNVIFQYMEATRLIDIVDEKHGGFV